MTQYTRYDGSTGFADLDDTVCTPSVATKLDTLFNAIIAAYNAIDNTNIAASPKIAASKVDLSTGGYVPLDGSVDMSGMLVQAFDSIFRTMRAAGVGRLREYRGADGALWGVSYNTYYNGSAWVGRDVTDICAVIKMESSGLHYYHAVSAAAGVVPTWVELLNVGTTGIATASIGENVRDSNISWANAGAVGNTMVLGHEISDATGTSTWTTISSSKVYIPANATTLTYYGSAKYTGGSTQSFRLIVASANGSTINISQTTYTLEGPGTLDISAESGWTTVNIQILTAGSGGTTGYVKDITGSFS